MNTIDEDEPGDPSANQGSGKSESLGNRPVPPVFENISANGCRTIGCDNFGLPPQPGPLGTGHGRSKDGYAIVNKGSSVLACRKCGKSTSIKSNKAIHEEMTRLAQGSLAAPVRHCPDCGSVDVRGFGKTRHGSQRYQCKGCGKTFSEGKATLRQRVPHKNEQIFKLLINKMPLSRICEVADISFATLYGKIDFISEQCRKFVADRELELCGKTFDSLYFSTDRQDYMVNWGDRKDKKTIQLTAIASAEQKSGYVFGLIPNFDKSIHPDDLEDLYQRSNDQFKAYALRETARYWTYHDYNGKLGAKSVPPRDDLDVIEDLDLTQQLPKSGCQVHSDYMVHAHYWLLKHHFAKAAKMRFFIDNDIGLLGGVFGAFKDRVKARTADIVAVDCAKSLMVHERQKRFANAKQWFDAEMKARPGMSAKKVRTEVMAQIIASWRLSGEPFNEYWFDLPFPDLAEPDKRIRFLTDHNDMQDHHLANLLLRATLWPVDTVFNRIRRRMSLTERPVTSVSRARRSWHIYAPYDPAQLEKMLTIFRCWQNYVAVPKKDSKSAAQKLGIAYGEIRLQDIIHFR